MKNLKRRLTSKSRSERGIALIYIAITLTTMLLFTGLAVDGGRAYVVKAQLTKAVDGAALGAARSLNSGDPRAEATRIFKANFPTGFMGTSSVTDPTADPSFFASHVDVATGVNVVNVQATAVMPTTFMKLGNINDVTVRSAGEAQRRMVDLSLVIDVSSSIGSQWSAVRDATRSFIDSFDQLHDRLSLVLFSTGAQVQSPMSGTRGFDKAALEAAVPTTLPNGSTLMTEGLYRGWDQLRVVPTGQQSGLRIIVLFTDGASNGVPARWGATGTTATSIRTADFPDRGDPDHQTWNDPSISGVITTNTVNGTQTLSPGISFTMNATSAANMQNVATVNSGIPAAQAAYRHMPNTSWHTQYSSAGMPTSFPLVSNTLTVNGLPQSTRRSLITDATGAYPTTLWNVNNAARNLLEIIADGARTDAGGDYPIRIYTIGMGNLARLLLGTMPETPESILQRIANDPVLVQDHNGAQLDGKYFYAQTAADVAPAFQGIQNQILRLSR